ncbi:MAG TPA: hypothetical protein VEB42_14425, partial [Chitinophagaceae bacterium]|nr:hypothetical protein [Chitinophagaceae bacterium]
QYIKLLCDGDKDSLLELTKKLINAYTVQSLQPGFDIHLNENPKEITANGAVMYSLAERHEKERYDSSIQLIHPGFNPSEPQNAAHELKEKPVVADVKDINSPMNIAVLNNLNTFLEKTLNNRDITNFLTQFNVTKCAEVLNALKWDGNIDDGNGLVYDSYRKVLKNLCAVSKDEDDLPESLFFYGLKESLYLLSKNITNNKY